LDRMHHDLSVPEPVDPSNGMFCRKNWSFASSAG
jgi:hypothetical protein